MASSSVYTTTRLNATTFLLVEDDDYYEHPYIYAKIHPTLPVIVLSDTGCDAPKNLQRTDKYIHLREYLEHYPLECNDGRPVNADGERTYVVLCTHCHFDHIGGIAQFVEPSTDIVASAAGRDFIESDLQHNSLFDLVDGKVPLYTVTHWANAFERLTWPLRFASASSTTGISESDKSSTNDSPEPADLGITILHTPGHTPDELAWYDHGEMHLYVGDSFYEEGTYKDPIVMPPQGNLVEWTYSMRKLRQFIKSENARAATSSLTRSTVDNYVEVRRVKVGCGHATSLADGEEILERLNAFWRGILSGKVPVQKTLELGGEVCDLWAENDRKSGFSFRAPRRLVEDARRFFEGEQEARA